MGLDCDASISSDLEVLSVTRENEREGTTVHARGGAAELRGERRGLPLGVCIEPLLRPIDRLRGTRIDIMLSRPVAAAGETALLDLGDEYLTGSIPISGTSSPAANIVLTLHQCSLSRVPAGTRRLHGLPRPWPS